MKAFSEKELLELEKWEKSGNAKKYKRFVRKSNDVYKKEMSRCKNRKISAVPSWVVNKIN